MKKNMKKLTTLLVMVMLVLGLTACGSSDEPQTTVVEADLADQFSQFFVSNIITMSTEELQYYVDMDSDDLQMILDNSGIPLAAEVFQDFYKGYMSDLETYGDYVSTDFYELKGDEEEATHTTELTFTNHPATITLVFDEDGAVTSAVIDPVLSTGEILEKAALNTVIGMGTVFIVLIFISFIIALLPKLTGLVENAGKKKAVENVPAAPAKATAPAPVAVAEEELVDDLELVAVISAAIAEYTGTSSDGFVVRSIKRSKSNKWKNA